MPIIQREGVQIYYEEYGVGNPVIFTYGLAGNTSLWQPQVDALSAEHRFIVWDQRGHGRSDSPLTHESYGVWTSVEDLRALMAHLAIDRAVVGGQSMGGGVAARFALRYPGQTNGLVIMNSHNASGLNSSPDIRTMRASSLDIVRNEGMSAMADFSMQRDPNTISHLLCSSDDPEATRSRIRNMFWALNPNGYINAVLAARNSDDISGRLNEIRAPTLLLTGDRDPVLPSMLFINGQIAGSQIEVIAGAGHHANLDKPGPFNVALLRFLARIAQTESDGGKI